MLIETKLFTLLFIRFLIKTMYQKQKRLKNITNILNGKYKR